jgi:hypothetical protein
VAQAGAAQAALAVEQVDRAAHPEPQATRAAGTAVRAATALLSPPAGKAVQLAMVLRNPPAAPARIASIPQGRALGRGALVRTVNVNCHPTPSGGTSIGRQALPEHLGSNHLTASSAYRSPVGTNPVRGWAMGGVSNARATVTRRYRMRGEPGHDDILASTFTSAPTLREQRCAVSSEPWRLVRSFC